MRTAYYIYLLFPLFTSLHVPNNIRIDAFLIVPLVGFKRPNFVLSFEKIKRLDQDNASDEHSHDVSNRRDILRKLVLAAGVIPITVVSSMIQPVHAGKPEIDIKSGQLYSPKGDMLDGGGSDMARGIKMQSRPGIGPKDLLLGNTKANGLLQTVYETRFIAYLSRFLLNFDPGAKSWWEGQDFEADEKRDSTNRKQLRFSEFAESVEIGLVDYFVGPYGSYGSVQAAKAGLLATAQVKCNCEEEEVSNKIRLGDILSDIESSTLRVLGKDNEAMVRKDEERIKLAKQGILNLFALLKARYTSNEAKRQLALLFSLISDPRLQPSAEIKSILGEIDDASIIAVELVDLFNSSRYDFRSSSRHGGGYSKDSLPTVTVEAPPALGDEYHVAKVTPVLEPTSRILRICVTDGGVGYTSAPTVKVLQDGVKIACEACAILGRNGTVESIVVLNPGLGYRRRGNEQVSPSLQVVISSPNQSLSKRKDRNEQSQRVIARTAKAYAELEYAITGLTVVEGGNGFVSTEPPSISISPPSEDPEWYIDPIEQKYWRVSEPTFATARVSAMSTLNQLASVGVGPDILKQLAENPLTLLPSTIRPMRVVPIALYTGIQTSGYKYEINGLPPATSKIMFPSSRYRAFDQIFGGIGSKPVTKSARELTTSEYSRLALSGAVCTVLVRTALNPLELIKTKIQLRNDSELMSYTTRLQSEHLAENKGTKLQNTVGTGELMKSLIKLRGFSALFQSADITFLASLVFGSFGFGATELFRRYFTMVFFGNDYKQQGDEELFLLAAAVVSSITTSAAAAPFEMLRVRSMAYIEPKALKTVFSDFLKEKRLDRMQQLSDPNQTISAHSAHELTLKDLTKDDIGPFFSGFYPIVSRELPFAVAKFLAFDLVAKTIISFINIQPQVIEPVEVGVGVIGLTVSAVSGAIAGLAGAVVSHPADLILTLISATKRKSSENLEIADGQESEKEKDWKEIVQQVLNKEGSIANLFVGLPARSIFFFMVIGLQFFLYDYFKTVFHVGSDDLTLILDVFYAVRQGLTNADV